MKRKLTISLMFLSGAFVFPLIAQDPNIIPGADDSCFNWHDPKTTTGSMGIYVSGHTKYGRVPLRPGTKPEELPKDGEIEHFYSKMSHHGSEESRAFSLHGSAGLKKDTWRKFTFSFIARSAGKVNVSIRPHGSHKLYMKYPNLHFVCYAKVESKQIAFQNPNFEKDLKFWGIIKDKKTDKKRMQLMPDVFKDPTIPGGRYLKTFMGISQTITVKKDQLVEVSFYCMPGQVFMSNKPEDITKK